LGGAERGTAADRTERAVAGRRTGVEMPWGRHQGTDLADLPKSYLRWLVGLENLDDELREAVRAELQRRGQRFAPAEQVLDDVHEGLVRRITEDEAIDYPTAALLSDHCLEALEDVRRKHEIGEQTFLSIAPPGEPRRDGPGGEDAA
jgi:hypothetical protein